jgi:hypothetical protein
VIENRKLTASQSTVFSSMRSLQVFVACALLVCIGCRGGSDRAPTAEVTGNVTLDGKPLKEAAIFFKTDFARMAVGKVVDGAIVEVTTYEENDGAPVGENRIAIQSVVHEQPLAPSAGPRGPSYAAKPMISVVVPQKYANPASSGLTAMIEEGTNELAFDLSSK